MDNLCYISLGSNLGNRHEYIRLALWKIRSHSKMKIVSLSPTMETAPLDYSEQPAFINLVLAILSDCTPLELLDHLQRIENELGRTRIINKGPRTIDIDILTYGNEVIQNPRLQIPHHSVHSRPFIKKLINECQRMETIFS